MVVAVLKTTPMLKAECRNTVKLKILQGTYRSVRTAPKADYALQNQQYTERVQV
jgi:hypothetical protein